MARLGFTIMDLAYEVVGYTHGNDFNTIEVNKAELIDGCTRLEVKFTVSNSRGLTEEVLRMNMWEILSWLACRIDIQTNELY